jgi:hypothetical protein
MKDANVTVEKHVGIAKGMFNLILEENVENNMGMLWKFKRCYNLTHVHEKTKRVTFLASSNN